MNIAVIGANFGDEGKGHMVDYFVLQQPNSVVVRFNGGAQAGHTVVTPEGRRHVFSHFGSGAFFGAPTYLSKYFIVNPLLYLREQRDLRELGLSPYVTIDENCLISTPDDMYINQALERLRGDKRHGSCGIGIHETIERSKEERYCLRAKDLVNDRWKKILVRIAEEWFPLRMSQIHSIPVKTRLNYTKITDEFEAFISQLIVDDVSVLKKETLIFEGAQGLLLDQNHSYFPYVTHSSTGMENVENILKELGREGEDLEAVYVTRTYLTRHGRGPFPTETEKPLYDKIEDDTNVYHEFQEGLRFGELDLPELISRVKADAIEHGVSNPSIAITCADQTNGQVYYQVKSKKKWQWLVNFVFDVRHEFRNVYLAEGKTRENISAFNGHSFAVANLVEKGERKMSGSVENGKNINQAVWEAILTMGDKKFGNTEIYRALQKFRRSMPTPNTLSACFSVFSRNGFLERVSTGVYQVAHESKRKADVPWSCQALRERAKSLKEKVPIEEVKAKQEDLPGIRQDVAGINKERIETKSPKYSVVWIKAVYPAKDDVRDHIRLSSDARFSSPQFFDFSIFWLRP